jgi:hypothetical protein
MENNRELLTETFRKLLLLVDVVFHILAALLLLTACPDHSRTALDCNQVPEETEILIRAVSCNRHNRRNKKDSLN